MTTEDEKTSIGRMGNRIIPVQEMLWLFPGELPTGFEFFRENIVGHFNREQGKGVLFQIITQAWKPSYWLFQHLPRQAKSEGIGKGWVEPGRRLYLVRSVPADQRAQFPGEGIRS